MNWTFFVVSMVWLTLCISTDASAYLGLGIVFLLAFLYDNREGTR